MQQVAKTGQSDFENLDTNRVSSCVLGKDWWNMANDLKSRVTAAIVEALTKRFASGRKIDVHHLDEVTFDTLAVVLPELLNLPPWVREGIEGLAQGVLEQAERRPELLDDRGALAGLFDGLLGKPKGGSGGTVKGSPIVDGLTAVGGMSKEARTAYGVMMGSAGAAADALIDRLMAVTTTPQTLEPAFLMPTPELQLTTFRKILGRIEAEAAKAKAPKPAGKDPLDALLGKARGVLDRAEAGAVGVRADRLREEAAELLRRYPVAQDMLDDPTDYAALVARAEKDPYEPLTLTQAYERM